MELDIIKSIVDDLVDVNADLQCTHVRFLQLRKQLLSVITSVYEKTQFKAHFTDECDSTIPTYTYKEFQSYFKVLRELNK